MYAPPLMRGLFLAVAVICLIIAVACGGGSADGSSEPPIAFDDAKGRHCSHEHYLSRATCESADAAVATACATGSQACFIVYVGQTVPGDAGPLAQSMMWNCNACCKAGSTAWTGVSTDCTSIVCTNNDPCKGQDGVCDQGKCRVRIPSDPKP